MIFSDSTDSVRPRESGDPGPRAPALRVWVPAFAGTNGESSRRSRRGLRGDAMSGDFTPEQKRYLEGFTAGMQIARSARAAGGAPPAAAAEPTGPDAPHILAQDRVINGGGKLSDQEKFKREEHPFDAYGRLKQQAANNEAPKAPDNFRWRYYGLFYCAPAQSAYMCRL